MLAVARNGAATIVERASAASPLKLMVTRNHGHAAWVFAATYGGGLVDGDQIDLAVRVGAGAGLLVGTQAATKVFRSPRGCGQRLTAEVAEHGLLVLLPDPVACFAGAHYTQEIAVRLPATASLLLVDGLTSGRSARGERWQFSRYASRIMVDDVAGAPAVRDALVLDPAHGPLPARMGRFDALATILALGPRVAPIVADLCADDLTTSPPRRRADLLAVASPLSGGAIVRLAGTGVEQVTNAVRQLLRGLPALLGDDPFARKY